MNKIKISAEKRTLTGKQVKKLRREGIIPANVYGKKIKSQAIQVKLEDILKVFEEAGETGLIELKIGKDQRSVLIHNIQKDPIGDLPLHVDFLQVNLKEKVTAQVPVEVVGECPAEKQGLGTLVQYIDEIEVEALPMDLPEKFEIDASKFEEVNQTYLVSNIKVDLKKVDIKTDKEQIIIKIEPPKKEEEIIEEIVPEGEAAEEEVVEEKEGEEGKDEEEKKEENKEEVKE